MKEFRPRLPWRAAHIQTIYPGLFRINKKSLCKRERLITMDGDFLDLDWYEKKSRDLVILSHGLEGSSRQGYILGMANVLGNLGVDILAWNARGCSGEINRLEKSYHLGETDDLDFVINHALKKNNYQRIALIGFSMGGNFTLKYLGEKRDRSPKVNLSITFSVPCNLEATTKKLEKISNRMYLQSFLFTLKKKTLLKKRKGHFAFISISEVLKLRNFFDFDDKITAPCFGFKDAHDYWNSSSCENFISGVGVRSFIVNALDDPFLEEKSFPIKQVAGNDMVELITPKFGGHVGFFENPLSREYYSEKLAKEILKKYWSLK